ncbi:MAG: hypothetical protein LBU61_06340 [Coriobacteriales bacterium]|nr:hypothetical protein [Coriobacteriales bacterium]
MNRYPADACFIYSAVISGNRVRNAASG